MPEQVLLRAAAEQPTGQTAARNDHCAHPARKRVSWARRALRPAAELEVVPRVLIRTARTQHDAVQRDVVDDDDTSRGSLHEDSL